MSDSQIPERRPDAAQLIEERRYREAIASLSWQLGEDSRGEMHAMIAVAHYNLQEYDEAAANYELALKRDPLNRPWQDMLMQSRANAVAEVNVHVPDIAFFDRGRLLAKPVVREDSLPATPMDAPRRGMFRWLRLLIGNVGGAVVSLTMSGITQALGRLAGYRDEVWTNWYRRSFIIGILTLAYMRERLNKNNLKSTYPLGSLIGFQPEGQSPPPGVRRSRTADGSWNNLADPKEGAAGTRFPRNVTNDSIRPETGDALMTPNPRDLSRAFLARGEEMKEVPFLNLLAASWINFQNHDWVHHGEPLLNEVHEIPLAEDDPARKKHWQTKMFIGKTQADPTRMPDKDQTPMTFINEVTHWWDGSQIYGSNQETLDKLRTGVDGKLRLDDAGNLPLDDKGIERTGFTRNWWVGLTMLHTLFTREHNAICDRLKKAYPNWDDARLFGVARLVNAAVMAKIHTVEWTPAILPNRGLDSGLHANWYGLFTMLRASENRKTVADINVRNPEMGGVVGNPINKHGQPYGLTEEFVEVYRLHSLLPETIEIRSISDAGAIEEVPFVETRQAGSGKVSARTSMADLFYSFGVQHPGQLVLNNYPNFMRELSIPGNPLFDMGAVDILRARERGVPRYNEFRRQLGLNPIRTFDDLTDDREQVKKLKAVYGDQPGDVEKLDLLIGTLGEGHRPTGFGFGETLFQIFILNATRRLHADRFYTDDYNEQTYTKEGLAWIDDSDLKTVILRHFPELASTGLGNVKNAFEPWDTGRLDPARHPLRGFNRELRPDPWLGDAWKEVYVGGSPGTEKRIVHGFIDQIKQVQVKNKEKSGASVVQRAFHAKILAGVTNAEFRISSAIPRELQIGSFQPNKIYRAAVRLSNASGVVQSDTVKDLRGAAIRVTTDEGIVHDFLMTNADPNHVRDAQQFMKVAVADAKASSRLSLVLRLIFVLRPSEALRVIRTVSRQMARKVTGLASETYWSRAPIKFGPFAVKYSLHPPLGVKEMSRASGDNYLREDFIAELMEGPITFDFKIQRFVDEARTPIEDGSVKWESEPEMIAQLVIPRQDLRSTDGSAMHDEVNDMAFNPWHTSDEFRPLGSLNRSRKVVYESSAGNRAR